VHLERLVPDPSLYPVDEFRRALNHVVQRSGRALLDYGDPRGHEGLRRVIVERLAACGIEADPDALVVTSGSTQALSLVVRLFCDPGDGVAVEDPGYPGVYAALAALGLRPVPIPVLADGLDLDALGTVLSAGGVRLLYTMPTFHNPTGISTSLEHRHRLLELAARHGIPVLEDDFEKDLRVRGRPVPPLRALDGSGRVVYVGTFSKVLFPGVRVGWVLAGSRLLDAALALKRASDLATSHVIQAALAHFCRLGGYDRHVRRVGKELGRRFDAALAAFATHLPEGSSVVRPEGGLAAWVTLPDAIDTLALLPEAKRAGIVYAPGCVFHADRRRSSSLRLSVAAASPEDIGRAVQALATVTRSALQSATHPRRAADAAHAVHV
jgi:DNA-binding transcriptional MocR family regulator